ncbi:MAG: metal-dependent hydrolase [Telluria sp.]
MPFTPFHLGPGALFKAIGGRHFSFMVFGGSQVMMDIEPLIGLIQDKPVLHGYTHTLAGALLIGLAAAVIGKPVSAWVLRLLAIAHYQLTWRAAFAGAMLGTFSHIVLDAVMHSDINPWWPIAQGNGLLKIIPVGALHLLCLGLGVVSGAVIAFHTRRHGKA